MKPVISGIVEARAKRLIEFGFEPDPSYPGSMFYYDPETEGYVVYCASKTQAVMQGKTKAEAHSNLIEANDMLDSIWG